MLKLLFIGLAVPLSLTAMAHANEPTSQGYLQRAQSMLVQENYQGCIDQAKHALQLPMTPDEQRTARLTLSRAMVHTQKARAAQLLQQWLEDYRGNDGTAEALLALGDCYYGSDDAKALAIYQTVPEVALSPELAQDLNYRMAYCYIGEGAFDKATQCLDQLDATERYGRAATFYHGYIAYAQGDYAAAQPMLKQASMWRQAPCDMADYYLAQMEYARENYSEALASAKALINNRTVAPQYISEAYRLTGESLWHAGDRAAAVPYLQKYREMAANPEPSALYMLGVEAYAEGKYKEAMQLLEPATTLGDAMSQSAYLYMGQAQLAEGDYNGAVLSFDKALNTDYDRDVQETAYYNYAVAALKGGKVPFGTTIGTLESFLQKFPDSPYAPQVQQYLVAYYLNNKNYQAALQSINAMPRPTEETLRLKQHVLYQLGAKTLAAGNAPEAITLLGEAASLDKYNKQVAAESTLLLGEAYYADGQYDKAAKTLLKYVMLPTGQSINHELGLYDLAYAEFKLKNYKTAATYFEKATQKRQGLETHLYSDALTRLGDCYYYQSQFEKASEAYGQASRVSPKHGDYPLFQKAVMEGYLKHHDQKIALLKQLQEKFPESALIPDAMLETTASYIQLGNNGEAIAVYRQLIDQYPNTSQGRQGYLQMAQTLINMGKKDEAIEAYKKLMKTYPTSEEAAIAIEQYKRIASNDGSISEYMAFVNSVPALPRMEASEAEALTFETAEMAYITQHATDRLERYLNDYPQGANRAKALYHMMDSYLDTDAAQAYAYACQIAKDYPDSHYAEEALAVKGEHEMAIGKGNLALRTYQTLEQRSSDLNTRTKARVGMLEAATIVSDDQVAISAGQTIIDEGNVKGETLRKVQTLLGEALSRQGDTEKALKLLQTASSTDSEYGMRSQYDIAEHFYKAGDLQRAEDCAQNLATANSDQIYWIARGFILLSDIYTKQGNDYKAQQYLITLRDKYPGTEAEIFEMIQKRLK